MPPEGKGPNSRTDPTVASTPGSARRYDVAVSYASELRTMAAIPRNRMAANAHESVKHLTIEEHARRVCRVYEEILREKRAKYH